jgi:hypothetical protein
VDWKEPSINTDMSNNVQRSCIQLKIQLTDIIEREKETPTHFFNVPYTLVMFLILGGRVCCWLRPMACALGIILMGRGFNYSREEFTAHNYRPTTYPRASPHAAKGFSITSYQYIRAQAPLRNRRLWPVQRLFGGRPVISKRAKESVRRAAWPAGQHRLRSRSCVADLAFHEDVFDLLPQ